jgi:hypothetical protein
MRRRLITSLAIGVLLLAGFTAAAVASGGSPLDLIASPATTAHGVGSTRGAKPNKASKPTPARRSSAEIPDADTDEDSADAAEHKVVICHHTGSRKHPFHPISVDENSATAHIRHGDTRGNCPSAPASAPRTTTHARPPWAHGPKNHLRGAGSEQTHGAGNSAHGKKH